MSLFAREIRPAFSRERKYILKKRQMQDLAKQGLATSSPACAPDSSHPASHYLKPPKKRPTPATRSPASLRKRKKGTISSPAPWLPNYKKQSDGGKVKY